MIEIEQAIELLKPFINRSPPWSPKTILAAYEKLEKSLFAQFPGESKEQIKNRLIPYQAAMRILINLNEDEWPNHTENDQMDSFPYFHIYRNPSDLKSGWGFLDMDHASWIICIVSIGVILIVMWIGGNEFFA